MSSGLVPLRSRLSWSLATARSLRAALSRGGRCVDVCETPNGLPFVDVIAFVHVDLVDPAIYGRAHIGVLDRQNVERAPYAQFRVPANQGKRGHRCRRNPDSFSNAASPAATFLFRLFGRLFRTAVRVGLGWL